MVRRKTSALTLVGQGAHLGGYRVQAACWPAAKILFEGSRPDVHSNVADPRLSPLHEWRRALEAAGVTFIDETEIDGPGVRLKKQTGKKR